MKNILLLFFFCIGRWAVTQQESNPFSAAERNISSDQSIKSTEVETANGPVDSDGTNDADPVLVDDYIPLLVITAVVIERKESYYPNIHFF